jgi:hypothetical protein
MAEVNVDITVGGCLPFTVVPTSADATIMPGAGTLNGWSLRDVTPDVPSENSGQQVAPVANTIIAQLTGLAAGTYQIQWTIGLQGPAAAADANNFKLNANGVQIETSVNPGAAGEYVQPVTEVTVTAGQSVSIQNIGAGTAGVTYSATLTISPTFELEAVAQLLDNNASIGEITFQGERAQSQWFGTDGPIIQGGLVLHIVKGTITGAIYITPSRP